MEREARRCARWSATAIRGTCRTCRAWSSRSATATRHGAERRVNVLATAPGLRQPRGGARGAPRRRRPARRRPGCGAGCWSRSGSRTAPAWCTARCCPTHVLIEPDRARRGAGRLVLLGRRRRDRFPALVPEYADWYPAEVHKRRPPGPGTDIAMAARCMSALMGRERAGGAAVVRRRLRTAAARQRPDDAWRLLDELDGVLERLYGPRRFRPFARPAPKEEKRWEVESGRPTSTTRRSATARATGASAFAYSDSGARRVHARLDPCGVTMRESRDSDRAPASRRRSRCCSTSPARWAACRACSRQKLPQLLGLLLRKGYATRSADHVRRDRRRHLRPGAVAGRPVRVGQPDGRRPRPHRAGGRRRWPDDRVVRAGDVLHGPAHAIDCFEKRGRRGYLFIIGDEMAYPRVKAREVARHHRRRAPEDVPLRPDRREVTRMYDMYFLLPSGTAYAGNTTSSASGATCSARTPWSSTTWTRPARRSGSRSASARARSTSTRAARPGAAGSAARRTVSKALARSAARGRVVTTPALPSAPSGDDRIERL